MAAVARKADRTTSYTMCGTADNDMRLGAGSESSNEGSVQLLSYI